jgi:hypothetical protein
MVPGASRLVRRWRVHGCLTFHEIGMGHAGLKKMVDRPDAHQGLRATPP